MRTVAKSIFIILLLVSGHGLSQNITGCFNVYEDEDGENVIYFNTTNLTGYPISNMVLVLENEIKDQYITLYHNGLWFSNGYSIDYSVMVGSNYNWTWEKGEKVHMYLNGQYHGFWECNIETPSLWEKIQGYKMPKLPKGWSKEVRKMIKRIGKIKY